MNEMVGINPEYPQEKEQELSAVEKLALEIAQAQAELDEQEAALTAEEELPSKQLQLEILRAKKANNALFEKLKVENPNLELARVEYDDGLGMVVVKRPTHLAYRQLQDQDKITSAVCEKFVVGLVVYPDKAKFVDLVTTQCKCDLLFKATTAAKELGEANARVVAKKSRS